MHSFRENFSSTPLNIYSRFRADTIGFFFSGYLLGTLAQQPETTPFLLTPYSPVYLSLFYQNQRKFSDGNEETKSS